MIETGILLSVDLVYDTASHLLTCKTKFHLTKSAYYIVGTYRNQRMYLRLQVKQSLHFIDKCWHKAKGYRVSGIYCSGCALNFRSRDTEA